MYNILLKDNKNKIMQEMLDLTEEVELLICENINKINIKVNHFSIETLDNDTSKFWISKGYTIDNSLYERLVINYNNTNPKSLTRWK